jgi:hypothetical protein
MPVPGDEEEPFPVPDKKGPDPIRITVIPGVKGFQPFTVLIQGNAPQLPKIIQKRPLGGFGIDLCFDHDAQGLRNLQVGGGFIHGKYCIGGTAGRSGGPMGRAQGQKQYGGSQGEGGKSGGRQNQRGALP